MSIQEQTRTFIRKTADGRYGLTGPDKNGVHTLWKIATPEQAAQFATEIKADPDLARLIGTCPDVEVGFCYEPENIEWVAEIAEEEIHILANDARAEFGF
jgi:hypothetical protein